jgi:hypothetical protein
MPISRATYAYVAADPVCSLGALEYLRERSLQQSRGRKSSWPICQPIISRCPKPIPGFTLAPTSVGENLRNWRLKAGLLQRELAERLGVDPMTVLS